MEVIYSIGVSWERQ